MDTTEAEAAHTPDPKPGSKRPLPGTPGAYNLNTEHQIYNMASPTIAQDSKTTKINHPTLQPAQPGTFPLPSTQPSSSPVTLADIANLLQAQLAPISANVDQLTKNMNDMNLNMNSNLHDLKHEINIKIDHLDERLTQLELNPPTAAPPKPTTTTSTDVSNILKLKSTSWCNLTSKQHALQPPLLQPPPLL